MQKVGQAQLQGVSPPDRLTRGSAYEPILTMWPPNPGPGYASD